MGIINLSHDSFYEGSVDFNYIDKQVKKSSYCDIIDIGAETTKPFSNQINEAEEIARLQQINVKELFSNKYISIDSYKYNVIKYALNNGYNMINDISAGGVNNKNLELSAEYDVPIVLMHMKGLPKNMQINPKYNNVIDEIVSFFELKIEACLDIGVKSEHIIIDPGLGFGKTKIHNYKIINNISKFKSLGYPVLIGLSRKSFLSFDDDLPNDRMYSSLSAMSVSIYNGADIIRVHDIEETYKALQIVDRLKIHSTN
tara:strand:- start:258 stop:1028 length:771 start_codon:yes stop_codon:yes gene_type:complete